MTEYERGKKDAVSVATGTTKEFIEMLLREAKVCEDLTKRDHHLGETIEYERGYSDQLKAML